MAAIIFLVAANDLHATTATAKGARPGRATRATRVRPFQRVTPKISLRPAKAKSLGAAIKKNLRRAGKPIAKLGSFTNASFVRLGYQTPVDQISRLRPTRPTHRAIANLDEVPLGTFLGAGGEKEVFGVAGDPDRVVGLLRTTNPIGMDRLLAEAEVLEEVKAAGYPTASFEVGTHGGRPAFIQERFELHSRDLKNVDPETLRATLNENTLRDLAEIRQVMRSTNTAILDFQFGIDRQGRVKIADPRNVMTKGPLALVIRGYMSLVLRYHETKIRRIVRSNGVERNPPFRRVWRSLLGRVTRNKPRGPRPALANLDDIQPESRPLGAGGEAVAFAIQGDPTRVVVLPRNPGPRALDRMLAQRELLHTLSDRGYPIADMQVGTMRGQSAFLQDRFVIHSHDLVNMEPAELRRFVSKTTLDDLRRIEALTVKTKTGIDGFQFGVFADHHVRINDPRNVYTGPVRGRFFSRAFTLRRIRATITAVEQALAE